MSPVQTLYAGINPKGDSGTVSDALGNSAQKTMDGSAGKIGFGCFFDGLRELSCSCLAREGTEAAGWAWRISARPDAPRFSSTGPDFNRFSRPARLPLTARILVIYG